MKLGNIFSYSLNRKQILFIELVLIIGLALVPLFATFPYRVNIYLSWEGAYRMYKGLIPFKDFGMPTGFGFWIIPAMFFKIFGPYLFTLVKAQVFINIINGLSFRSILKNIGVTPGIRLLSVALFVLSFSFFNFWPWYNHTVIVFQIIGTNFLIQYIFKENYKHRWIFLILSVLFIFLSIFTKQDGGGMAFMICFAIIAFVSYHDKNWRHLFFFLLSFIAIASFFIIPFLQDNFSYWFNHGQQPHNSRISLMDILNDIFGGSQWIKFYFLLIVIILFNELKNFGELIKDKQKFVFLLLTLGILVEAAIFQVTSYTPPNNNIFFHSFACAFIFSQLNLKFKFNRLGVVFLGFVLLFFWWSGVYWKYTNRIIAKLIPKTEEIAGSESMISKNNYMLKRDCDTTQMIKMSEWKPITGYKAFDRMVLPESTIKGISRIMELDIVKDKGNKVNVLNMSELSPLAYEIGYEIEKGKDIPLWYHKGVGIFQKQVDQYCTKISNGKYDLVIFEYIPYLNNFFPFEIRDCLQKNYQLEYSFLAPRNPAGDSFIEVYIKKIK